MKIILFTLQDSPATVYIIYEAAWERERETQRELDSKKENMLGMKEERLKRVQLGVASGRGYRSAAAGVAAAAAAITSTTITTTSGNSLTVSELVSQFGTT